MAEDTLTAQTDTDAASSGSQAGEVVSETQQPKAETQGVGAEQTTDTAANQSDAAAADSSSEGETQGEAGGYELQLPEGVEPSDETVEGFKGVASELGLNNEQAQKLVDYYAELAGQQQESLQARWREQLDQWVESVKSDEELGGRNYDQTMSLAGSAMDKFATPELRQMLDDTGVGSNPEMVRLMARIGKAIGEDSIVQPPGSSGTQAPVGDKTYADVLYGTSNQ